MKITQARLSAAHSAIVKLYADWESNGGPSPDTADESRVIAAAIGSTATPTEDELGTIWRVSQEGANAWVVAKAHLEVL